MSFAPEVQQQHFETRQRPYGELVSPALVLANLPKADAHKHERLEVVLGYLPDNELQIDFQVAHGPATGAPASSLRVLQRLAYQPKTIQSVASRPGQNMDYKLLKSQEYYHRVQRFAGVLRFLHSELVVKPV